MTQKTTYVLRQKVTKRYFKRLNPFTDRAEDTLVVQEARHYPTEKYAAFAKTLFYKGNTYDVIKITL